MKKITFLLAAMLLLTTVETNAQDASRECTIKYNLFKGDYQSKKFDEAYINWIYLMDNCKDLSVNIYKFGATLSEDVRKEPTLAKRVYEQRLQYFPTKNPAKVHSDYATYLFENKLASNDEVFKILEKGYAIDPTKMGVKNLYIYFQGVTDRNKDTNPQKVFDTYDDVLENVNIKLANYAKKLVKYIDTTKVLDKRDKQLKRAYTVNSTALGTVEGGLDAIISEIATCVRLIPLYERDFEANKSNAIWLKRSVSRMFNKGCQEEPLFEKLVRAFAEASPSPEAYAFLANVLENNDDSAGAVKMREKSFELETDPLKKAKYKLKFAQAAKDRGQYSKARSLAREALKFNPRSGRAYLFIATLYQGSVNDCGDNLFEKRMVYVAALNMAKRAASVDPSISARASKYINIYDQNVPSQKDIFNATAVPGGKFTIKCWIGETVRIPNK
ncbi:MAG: tetratricopeptide (TPR) repeat protein [Polaribacter sp.]|jgi:tetratricopeptide (TPR) repeat protein